MNKEKEKYSVSGLIEETMDKKPCVIKYNATVKLSKETLEYDEADIKIVLTVKELHERVLNAFVNGEKSFVSDDGIYLMVSVINLTDNSISFKYSAEGDNSFVNTMDAMDSTIESVFEYTSEVVKKAI